MDQLRFENDRSDPGALATFVAGSIAAVAGCLWAGWVGGCLGFLVIGSIVLVLFETHSNARITPEVREAADLALEAARRKYPAEQHNRIDIRTIADDYYLFALRYWTGPGSRPFKRYFAVSRGDPMYVEEVTDPTPPPD